MIHPIVSPCAGPLEMMPRVYIKPSASHENRFHSWTENTSGLKIALIGLFIGTIAFIFYVGCPEFYKFRKRQYRIVPNQTIPI